MGLLSNDAGTQTTTQTLQPPDYAIPYLETALAEALAAFRAGPGGPPELSAQTQQGVDLLSSGAGGAGDATNLLQQTLQGDFLDPSSNPYLESTFNTAADQVLQTLASRFAGAGRNVGASLPRASSDLQQLAAGIYGPAYDAERGRQQQALALTPTLSSLVPQQLFTAGSILESQESAEINAPQQQLNDFLTRITSTLPLVGSNAATSSPLTTNPLAGGLGGAIGGAQLGSKIPGLGTGVGAGIGGLIGFLSNLG